MGVMVIYRDVTTEKDKGNVTEEFGEKYGVDVRSVFLRKTVLISTHLFPQGYLNGLFLMNSLGYRNFDLFVRTNSLMSLQLSTPIKFPLSSYPIYIVPEFVFKKAMISLYIFSV